MSRNQERLSFFVLGIFFGYAILIIDVITKPLIEKWLIQP